MSALKRTFKNLINRSKHCLILVALSVLSIGWLVNPHGQAIAEERGQIESLFKTLADEMQTASAQKGDGAWTVVDSGGVLFTATSNSPWRPISKGHVFAPSPLGGESTSHLLRTGPKGWAVLGNGKDIAFVTARTRIALTDPVQKAGSIIETRIQQTAGTMLFKVDKRPGRQFKVQTPHLIAGVKGTIFSVSTDDDGASVSVTEGTVGVASDEDSDDTDITAGETGTVTSDTTDVEVSVTPIGKATAPGQIKPAGTRAIGKAIGKLTAPGQLKDKTKTTGKGNSSATGKGKSSSNNSSGNSSGSSGGSSSGNSGGSSSGNSGENSGDNKGGNKGGSKK